MNQKSNWVDEIFFALLVLVVASILFSVGCLVVSIFKEILAMGLPV